MAVGLILDKRIVKVLKAVAELEDISLNELVGRIILHALEGTAPFSEATLKPIERLKIIYGLSVSAVDRKGPEV